MTAIHEKQNVLKHNHKTVSSEVELALMGIEVMEEIQQMARKRNVYFSLDADDGFGCYIRCNKSYLEIGLKLLAKIHLENCHSGNELRMKVTHNGFHLRAVYVEFPDEILDLLNGKCCGNKETVQNIQSFKDYIAKLKGSIETCCDESGCKTEIMLQAY